MGPDLRIFPVNFPVIRELGNADRFDTDCILSHAVASLWARQASWIELRFKSPLGPLSERASSSRAATQPKSAWHDFCHDFSQLCRRARQGKGLPVLSARQFIGAATTALSLITGAFLLALAAGNARAQGSAPACDAAGENAPPPPPRAPREGAPPRGMRLTAKPPPREASPTRA